MYKKDAKIDSLPTINGGHMSTVGHWTSLRQQVKIQTREKTIILIGQNIIKMYLCVLVIASSKKLQVLQLLMGLVLDFQKDPC